MFTLIFLILGILSNFKMIITPLHWFENCVLSDPLIAFIVEKLGNPKHKSVFYFYNNNCLTTRWCIGYLTFHFGLLLYIQHNSLEYIFSLIRKRDDANMISAFTRFSERWKAMTHHKIFTTNPVQGIANSITTFLCRYIIFH